jgi:nitrogen fixation NifU-like protein
MGKYSDILMDHFTSPRNVGCVEPADAEGRAGTPHSGQPFMVLTLRIADGTVREARYKTYGCGATIAAGSMLTEMVRGRTVAECLTLTPADLIEALDGVPGDKLHCPALAIDALRSALRAYQGTATP